LKPQGFDLDPRTPEEFAVFLRNDLTKWSRVAAAAGIRR
jgi:hypothetical protein